MTDPKLNALTADVKRLTARVAALEKLLERIVRQKPVSEKQLERALRRVGLDASEAASL
jgi:outer membrane murein-binding lipoprotein Lpp